ncbi:hypothetical protein VCRA2110O1_550001 [Vibrio crassostreae]|nr:hypothetical protein VCRA2110O1_550001 [Vibrio crassostreae]
MIYLRVIQSNLKVLNVYLLLDKHNKHIQVSCIRFKLSLNHIESGKQSLRINPS